MNDLRDVIKWNKKLIDLIKQNNRDTNPKGLHEAINSIEDKIPGFYVKRLRWIASVRNNVVHEEKDIPKDYSDQCQELYNLLLDYFSSQDPIKVRKYQLNKKSQFFRWYFENNEKIFKRNNLMILPIAILLVVSTIIIMHVKESNSNILPWNPSISFIRDDDLLNKDDYFINLKIINSDKPYNGNISVSLIVKGIAEEKNKNVNLIEKESETFTIPVKYSIVNHEDANQSYIAKCLEGGSVIIKTGPIYSKKYFYKIRKGKLSKV
jgi:hypothetical protein